MSMSQSLFSAISGLINHQFRLDNVGNNLANINTVGYKRNVLRFQDILSQTIRGGMAPDSNRGGINPLQLGLGVQHAGRGRPQQHLLGRAELQPAVGVRPQRVLQPAANESRRPAARQGSI